MAIDHGSQGASTGKEVLFRCHGCSVRFPDRAAGPGSCPRCGAIGGHERQGRP